MYSHSFFSCSNSYSFVEKTYIYSHDKYLLNKYSIKLFFQMLFYATVLKSHHPRPRND